MFSTVFLMLVLFFQPSELDTGYFYFGNTNLIGVGPLKDGFKSGEWKIYSKTNPDEFPDNSLLEADQKEFKKHFNQETPRYIMNFDSGVPNGDFIENYPNGRPKVVAYQKDGLFEGEFGEFYESGELRLRGMVLNGKKEGEWKEYLPAGELVLSIFFHEGLADGKALGYFQDGSLQWESNFVRGELDGPFISFSADSTIQIKGQFANGVPTGEWQERLEILPSFTRKGNYYNGVKEGEWQLTNLDGEFLQAEYYKGGKLISIGEFEVPKEVQDKGKVKNGRGQRYFYDEKGNIIARGKISNGKENGLWYFYFPESDRVSSSGKLLGSERVGNWSFYTYSGEIKQQIQYSAYKNHFESKGYFKVGTHRDPAMDFSYENRFFSISDMGQFLK